MSFDKYIESCTYHHNQDKKISISPESFLLPFCNQFPPRGKDLPVFYHYLFTFSRISVKRNHILCGLLCLLFFTQDNAFKIHLFLAYINSLLLLLLNSLLCSCTTISLANHQMINIQIVSRLELIIF